MFSDAIQQVNYDYNRGVEICHAQDKLPPQKAPVAHHKRRQFTADYKARIVEEAMACKKPGEISAILKREKLHSSTLSLWRKQYRAGAMEAFENGHHKRDGTYPNVEQLRLKNDKLRKMTEQAEFIIQMQAQQIQYACQCSEKRRMIQDRLIAIIEQCNGEIEVECLCRALSLPRASYYRKRTHAEPKESHTAENEQKRTNS